MEHGLLQPQHLTASQGFFNLCRSAGHGGWGLMQLDGGVDDTTVGVVAGDLQAARQTDGLFNDGPCRRPVVTNEKQHGVRELTLQPRRRNDGMVLGTHRKTRDRAKTIALERKRRVRNTEELYELRSLVPNITKMDKASIIADAVAYVKNLQSRAAKLEEEVAALEAARPRSPSSSHDRDDDEPPHDDDDRRSATGSGARVSHVGATRVGGEEGRFLVTVECERRDGAAARLSAAVESLTTTACFQVETSSLGRSAPDRARLTSTLKATCQVEAATIGEATVKLLMMSALSEEGFTIEVTTAGRSS